MSFVEAVTVAVEHCTVIVQLGVVGIFVKARGKDGTGFAELPQGKTATGHTGIIFGSRLGVNQFLEIRYGFTVPAGKGIQCRQGL